MTNGLKSAELHRAVYRGIDGRALLITSRVLRRYWWRPAHGRRLCLAM